MSRTHEMFHCPGATLARIWPWPWPVSCTCPMRRTTCAWRARAASAALAPEGGGVVQAYHPLISSASSLDGDRPATQARTVSTAAEPLASGASTVSQPVHAVAPTASVPRELWKPGTAFEVVPPVHGSFIRFDQALSSPKGLLGVQPWYVEGTR